VALLDSFVSRRSGANAMFQSLTVAWVRLARRAWAGVLVLALVAGIAALSYVRANLGIQTDTADMISPTLDWRQRDIDFKRQFPHFSDTLVIVVDGETPDRASAGAARLAAELARRETVFRRVDQPDDLAFFRRNALLYLGADERERLVEELVRAQPLLWI
jgi:predicted RND superfamily exporter protein